MTKIHVACVQMCSMAEVEENVKAADAWVRQAAGRGAKLIALPENAFYMRAEGTQPPVFEEAAHPGLAACEAWAKELGIWLLAGSVAVPGPEGRQYNRSVLFSPQGKVAYYDKIHLFDVEVGDGQTYRESARFAPGARAVVAETPWGGLGMTVCYDLRFPHLYRTLAQHGASLLAVPSAFTEPTGKAHWHALLRARAIENACYVIAPAQGGEHPGGRRTYGHSLIIGPWGEVLAEGNAPGVVMAEIDLSEVTRIRERLPSLKHDREYLYK